jgi:hypothetical protein
MAIESLKDSRLKSILDVYDPDTKQTKFPIDSAINANIQYVTKEIKRILPTEGTLEISAASFILKQKNRNPFEVHDILHSSAKYLSTLTNANITIVYDSSFIIKRKSKTGDELTLEKEKDQMIVLCVHWFIWHYSSNPYALDQGFEKVPASTNLLYGRMYGYQDAKEYDCSLDCWETYTPFYQYSCGQTQGLEFAVFRSKQRRYRVNLLSYEDDALNNKDNYDLKTKREWNDFLLKGSNDSRNIFHQIIPDLLEKSCFTNYGKIMRNAIAPYNAKDDWGNNFDALYFICVVFSVSRILKHKVERHILLSVRDEFLSECDLMSVSFSDLNLDRFAYDAIGGIDASKNNSLIQYGFLYHKLEKYLEDKLADVYADLKKRYESTEPIEYTAFLSLWNYILFGSYLHISMWNRRCANTAIDLAIVKITKYADNYELLHKKSDGKFDPTLN